VAVLSVIGEIVSGAKSTNREKNREIRRFNPPPPLTRVQMKAIFPPNGKMMPRQFKFGTGNYQGIRALV
jgi:hypothetical protein